MAASKKTVLRTIRLSAEHDRILEEDARKKGLSVNSLLTTLITKYAEWDRFAERFGYVSVGRQGFRRMFDLLTDEALVTHGRDVGAKNAPEITRFWFGRLNLETFFAFLTVHSKYSGLYQYELATSDRHHAITFHHELGPRYSVVLANYFDQAIKSIVGVAPKIGMGDNSCVVSFDEPRP